MLSAAGAVTWVEAPITYIRWTTGMSERLESLAFDVCAVGCENDDVEADAATDLDAKAAANSAPESVAVNEVDHVTYEGAGLVI